MKEDYIENTSLLLTHFISFTKYFPYHTTFINLYRYNQLEGSTDFSDSEREGDESPWAQNFQKFFTCLLKCCRELYKILSSLAVGRLFGPGFVKLLRQVTPENVTMYMYSKGCQSSHLCLWLFVSCLRSGDGISLHQFVFSKHGSSPVNVECKYPSLHDFCYQEKKCSTHDVLSGSIILLDLSLQVPFSDF